MLKDGVASLLDDVEKEEEEDEEEDEVEDEEGVESKRVTVDRSNSLRVPSHFNCTSCAVIVALKESNSCTIAATSGSSICSLLRFKWFLYLFISSSPESNSFIALLSFFFSLSCVISGT